MAKILLIEPDTILAQTYYAALKQNGHKVLVCGNAQQAVFLLDEHAVDVIVLELQLAEHNGVELLHEIRSYPEWDEIPVVLHSFVPQTQSALGEQFWNQLGIVQYLYKPHASLRRLNQVVSQVAASRV